MEPIHKYTDKQVCLLVKKGPGLSIGAIKSHTCRFIVACTSHVKFCHKLESYLKNEKYGVFSVASCKST